jgi:hypothetical protein
MRAEGKSRSLASLSFRYVFSRLDTRFHAAEMQKGSADPSEEMRSLKHTYDEAQGELKTLEAPALKVCRELEGVEGKTSGSSIVTHLRSLGGRVTEHLRGAL